MNTRWWQRIEGALVFMAALLGLALFGQTAALLPVWAMVVLFFAPDLGMIFYLIGPRAGAWAYNALHLYGAGPLLILLGVVMLGSPVLTTLGLLWIAHVGFDRMLGYGLKENSGFTNTHLGRIGRG